MAGYIFLYNISKVMQSPNASVKTPELVIWHSNGFIRPYWISSYNHWFSIYKRSLLHIETAEVNPDNSELTLLLMQLQQAIQDRNYSLYTTHIGSHTGLSRTLAKGNEETDQKCVGTFRIL